MPHVSAAAYFDNRLAQPVGVATVFNRQEEVKV